MDEEVKPDRRDRAGTWLDWPVGVIVLALVVLLVTGKPSIGATLLFWFGVVALLVRRGAFTPRGR